MILHMKDIFKRIAVLELEISAMSEVIKEHNPELFKKIQNKKKEPKFEENFLKKFDIQD